jgi:hypothetical protein
VQPRRVTLCVWVAGDANVHASHQGRPHTVCELTWSFGPFQPDNTATIVYSRAELLDDGDLRPGAPLGPNCSSSGRGRRSRASWELATHPLVTEVADGFLGRQVGPVTKIVQGWPKLWANFRALIGFFSQTVGPSLAIWVNPVQFLLVLRRECALCCERTSVGDLSPGAVGWTCDSIGASAPHVLGGGARGAKAVRLAAGTHAGWLARALGVHGSHGLAACPG